MIKQISSYRFPGFYEYSDEFIDDEDELLFELQSEGITGIEVKYEYEDLGKYRLDVCRCFMEGYVEKIEDVLPIEILENEDFKFEIAEEGNLTVISPKYYNYPTNECFIEVETNYETLKIIKDFTLKLEGAEKYIADNFTSYDGFISYLPNNIERWKSLDIEEYEENMLIALLDMLIELSDCTGFYNLAERTYYDVDKYYYVIPTVYCENKKIENEVKKIKPFVKTIITE
ncbi:MAG: hypothetical protein IKF82_02455 [Bacilli bacterium]|nr:hypothetical protein [Bacilli bacterium]